MTTWPGALKLARRDHAHGCRGSTDFHHDFRRQPEYRGHQSASRRDGLRHEVGPLVDQPDRLSKREPAGRNNGRIFADAVSGPRQTAGLLNRARRNAMMLVTNNAGWVYSV